MFRITQEVFIIYSVLDHLLLIKFIITSHFYFIFLLSTLPCLLHSQRLLVLLLGSFHLINGLFNLHWLLDWTINHK